ncbi:MAG: aldehyde dehydrogenase family protein [Planctomycetota bacterium]
MSSTSLIDDFATRRAAVRRFRGLLAHHADDLVRLMDEEINKPGFEALASDVLPLLSACVWHERHAARVLRDRRIPGKPLWLVGVRHRVHRAPLGRVAIIATWNYPVQLVGIQIVQAFIAGNTLLVKPSERSPRTQALLLDLFERAGIAVERAPATRDAGETLVREADFDHLVFTGSTAVGRAIARVLAERLIPSTLELSGNDTAVVLASADANLAARSVWYALTLNHGQTCMAPRRALVEPAIMERFLRELRTLADPASPRRLIDAEAADVCRRVARAAIEAGGELVVGDPESDPLTPIIIANAGEETALFRGKHFGPLLAVERLENSGSGLPARHVLHPTDPLTLSVFGTKHESRRWSSLASAGTVTSNDAIIPTGHPGAPLGAVGESGWGVSRGVEGLLAMTRPVSMSTTRKKLRLPLDPPGTPVSKITPWLRRLYAAGRAGDGAASTSTRREDA